MNAETNWARNLRYGARRLEAPETVDELRRLVASADRVKALGSRHSFNRIADTTGILISTHALDVATVVDAARRRVRVGPGVRYGELARQLDAHGWALGNLASLPHISVAGAVSTGTHGSGDASRSLSAAVTGLDLVTSAGELVKQTEGDPDLAGAVVGLGALGVVVAVELAIEPAFDVAQTVYDGIPFDDVLATFDEVAGSAYSVSMFTTLRDADVIDQVWRKARTDRDAPRLPAALLGREAPEKRHPLPGVSAQSCTTQGGVAGRWFDRLPHFELEFTPSNGDELQSEYLVPRQTAVPALTALRALAPVVAPLLQVCEIRAVAADELWLSPAQGRDSTAIHFTWAPDSEGVAAVLPQLEEAFAPFAARPHWGKLFSPRDPSSFADLYPHWGRFAGLRRRLDPRDAFANEFTSALAL